MDYVDNYYSRTVRERAEYPALTGDLHVETLVIGGVESSAGFRHSSSTGHTSLVPSSRV